MGGARGGEYFIYFVLKPRWSSGKIAPGDPSSGLKGSIFYLEIVNFFYFCEAAKLRWGGRAAPRWAW
jgi:hypothetical protein